jgi:hypothetical protein
MDRRPGCLMGLLELSFLRWIFNGAQRRVGFGSGSCLGCGCGFFLLIIFGILFLSIIFGTDWFKLVQVMNFV